MIQGPPGTGKTTVIAAILERLNEIATKEGARGQGQVLLSGFQHDAVENMIDRISLNGIPVPKFGKRSGSAVDDLNAFEKNLEEWCGRIAQELRAKNPQIADLEEESAINDLYKQYLRTPTHKLATTLVARVAEIDVTILGEKLSRQAGEPQEAPRPQQAVASDGQGRHLERRTAHPNTAREFWRRRTGARRGRPRRPRRGARRPPVGAARPSKRLEHRSRGSAVPRRPRTVEAQRCFSSSLRRPSSGSRSTATKSWISPRRQSSG